MKKINLKIQQYSWECGDGCCSEEGNEWYVNDEFVHRSPCYDNGILAVLEHLGFDAEMDFYDSEGEHTSGL
jgi:hypothetical protein